MGKRVIDTYLRRGVEGGVKGIFGGWVRWFFSIWKGKFRCIYLSRGLGGGGFRGMICGQQEEMGGKERVEEKARVER